MQQPRTHIALAVDGGGMRGLIVARALVALERALGGQPLIEHPAVKILAGTSTGALIAACLAMGYRADEIINFYLNDGPVLLDAHVPDWIPGKARRLLQVVTRISRPGVYSSHRFKDILRQMIGNKTGDPDLTLGDLKKRLRPDQTLIITVADVTERHTRFLKSPLDNDGDWKLWEAMLASSTAPVLFPLYERNGHCYADGALGCYANPAAVAAREMVERNGVQPGEVTLFSFGTGWVNTVNFERIHRPPRTWTALDWLQNLPLLMWGDTALAPSLDIVNDFMLGQPAGCEMDFRRFQIELDEDVNPDQCDPATIRRMCQLGDVLGKRLLSDQHALGVDPGFDPEGIRRAYR